MPMVSDATISSSAALFSSCLQSFPASESFPVSWLFALGGWSIGASASESVLPVSIQGWFPLGLTALLSLQSKGLSGVFSGTTVQKHQFLVISLLYDPTVTFLGFPDSSVGKESACNAGDSSSWIGKIHWRRERLPTAVFWPGESHALCGPWGCKQSDTTEWLSLSFFLTSYLTTGGTRALTVWTFVRKLMYLLFFFFNVFAF